MVNTARTAQKVSPFDKYRLDKSVFRSLFFRYYDPDWNTIWKPVEHLVKQYEALDVKGLDPVIRFRPVDEAKLMTLLKKACRPGDFKKIQTTLKNYPGKKEIALGFHRTYRRTWDKTKVMATRDFNRSNFRKDYEFFAIKFKLVHWKTPYQVKPKKAYFKFKEGKFYQYASPKSEMAILKKPL